MLNSHWYALTVKPRHERAASRGLREKGLDEFLPLYRQRRRWSDRWTEKELCLFPGYVFSRFSYEQRLLALGTPGIHSIVGFGKTPSPIPDSEIDAIRSMLASGRRIEPWPHLRAGERVRIEDGCLRGLCGVLVREKDAWRVVVSVEVLERSVAVEVDRESVSPVQERFHPLRQERAGLRIAG